MRTLGSSETCSTPQHRSPGKNRGRRCRARRRGDPNRGTVPGRSSSMRIAPTASVFVSSHPNPAPRAAARRRFLPDEHVFAEDQRRDGGLFRDGCGRDDLCCIPPTRDYRYSRVELQSSDGSNRLSRLRALAYRRGPQDKSRDEADGDCRHHDRDAQDTRSSIHGRLERMATILSASAQSKLGTA